MACRNANECHKAINDIQSKACATPLISADSRQSSNACGELIYKHLDLSSLSSVRTFVSQINNEESEIHALINNAAVYGDSLEITSDGFERNMQINHLAPSLLTLSLLPKLYQSNKSVEFQSNKIIFVTSTLYKKGKLFQDFFGNFSSNTTLKNSSNYSSYSSNVYPNTKLANLHFARELSLKTDLIKNIKISVASPGFAFTKLHRNVPKSRLLLMSLLTPLLLPFLRSSRDGAQTIIGCALMPETKSDILYRNCKSDLKLTFNDPSQSSKVYEWTMNSLKPFLDT